MTEEEYLSERLNDQLNWYDKKSQHNQRWFKYLRLVEIIAAALIPFLSGMGDRVPYSAWLIGALGLLIAVSAAVTALYKYQEHWIEYRTTAEQLRHEKYMYLAGAQPYDDENKFKLLVERVEALISKENSAWAAMALKQGNAVRKA